MIQSGMVSYHAALEADLVPIDSVLPHEENYNNGDVELIMESITVNGMYRPVFVQASTNRIVAGNHTWYACKELGAAVVPVKKLEIDDMTAKRLMVGDNEIARKARRDDGLLVKILEELNQEGGLMGTGMVEYDLVALRALAEMPPDLADEHTRKMWPTICFQVPPHVKNAFYEMTEQAGGDRERFELILRLAGWDK